MNFLHIPFGFSLWPPSESVKCNFSMPPMQSPVASTNLGGRNVGYFVHHHRNNCFHGRVCDMRVAHHGRTLEAVRVAAMDNSREDDCQNLRMNIHDEDLKNSGDCNATSFQGFDIHEARTEEELKVAARLRAETYAEQQPYTRYIESFKKKFAEQEYSALKRRVFSQFGTCICLLAVARPSSSCSGTGSNWQGGTEVIGTLDFNLHHPSPGESFGGQGLPYGYIANLCVDRSARQRGVGSALMQRVLNIAREWRINVIYVHALSTNEPACRLYSKKGFKVLHAGAIAENTMDDTLLLRLQL